MKICVSFEDPILNEITQDILLRRRSYSEIREHYSALLPPNVPRLNDVNISNHLRHSDPALLAKEHLDRIGVPATESDVVSQFYAQRFQRFVDKAFLMNEAYKERISNLEFSKKLRDEKLIAYGEAKQLKDDVSVKITKELEGAITQLSRQISEEQDALQETVFKHLKLENAVESRRSQEQYRELVIRAAKIIMFAGNMEFLKEVGSLLLEDLFADQPELGHRVYQQIGRLMDVHIKPVVSESRIQEELKRLAVAEEVPVEVIATHE